MNRPIQQGQGKKQILINTIGWGFILWLIGYVLGFIFFAFVPVNLIGWYIMPIGALIALWVLFKKIHREEYMCYFGVAIFWTLIAVVFDYLFIVRLLKPADGYYKLDVYIYYILTFLLPLIAGWWKMKKKAKA